MRQSPPTVNTAKPHHFMINMQLNYVPALNNRMLQVFIFIQSRIKVFNIVIQCIKLKQVLRLYTYSAAICIF